MAPKTILEQLKTGLGTIVLVATLLTGLGAILYKVNGIGQLTSDVQAQGIRLTVVEERAKNLKELRNEDLDLLRKDIKELKEMMQDLDKKVAKLGGK